ncbi:putative integral membrane protein [Pseudonocardia sp. Ae168_Ps1]|nr:hypothetical protein FRP1_26860 [Pseudonocardia sp. EC080625-04]ALL74978.1 hypothetical protein AD006_06045 [Pseudonocardia sp. EC080610-09]ALL82000.1 hypothetical protein AD017_13865 [Pseudonocardia sp. EC080619-01]OLL74926.1 putative integral membrane protein [Pseudonocardia sp. Ae150A_Ps1]OLL80917.1 putative integral membrane protein [Pseudonocardia sp. Ae168_Ps1]OLL84964.1 putative integral membrane protein [Pseudonocardia sp. Ae263_Ps1]OLL95019.1 putative integral membrane protein [Ps
MLIGMTFAVLAMLCSTVAAILQADAARRGGRTSAVLTRPRFIGGIGMDVVTWLCMVVALQFIPIFAVQATLAGAIAMTALYARWFRGEWLRPVHRLAIGCSIVGLALVAGSAGTERKEAVTGYGTTVAVLVAALVAVMVATLATNRTTRPWPPAVLAGLGLGGGSVCIRAMHVSEGVSVSGLLAEPLVYLLLGMAATGLYNYARALQLGDIATVTALYMVVQVVVPGLVGITLLDDTVRPGFMWLLLLGLVLVVYGTSILARRRPEKRTPPRVA